jgi:hypothetical protein
MTFNLHPYQQAYDTTDYNYMTLDMYSLNPYNYKNLTDNLIPYQKQEEMYYFTRQLNPLSLVTLSPQMMDPSNLPPDQRSTIYDAMNLNNQERNNQYQTPANNPNLWQDNTPAPAMLYELPRQMSSIQAGQATSFQEFHGMQLY